LKLNLWKEKQNVETRENKNGLQVGYDIRKRRDVPGTRRDKFIEYAEYNMPEILTSSLKMAAVDTLTTGHATEKEIHPRQI
jgi:hypothetical protein